MNSIYFTTPKELAEPELLQVISTLAPAKQIVWLDSVNAENVGNKDTIFAAKKVGNGQYKYQYEIFFRDYTGILSLREKVDWLKQLATSLQIEVLTPDEEIDPYTYILIDTEKTYPVDKKSSGNKQEAIDDNKPQGTLFRNNTSRNFPDCSTWIFCIKVSVEVAVECHGSASGEDHAKDYQNKFSCKFII